jgi:hypothetical protein
MTPNNNKYQNAFLLENNLLRQKSKKLMFLKHFAILDSTANANPNDTIYCCCRNSVDFMVKNTKIEISTDANIIGRLEFSKSDLAKWHAWFDKRYKKVQPFMRIR